MCFGLRILVFVLLLIPVAALARKQKKIIKIYDKITMMTHPLMIKATAVQNNVTFTWNEPHWDFKYFLEIYREGNRKPIGVVPVQGGKKVLSFKKKKETLFWRISAVSKHGNKNPNRKIYKVPLSFK